jgi:hypothetical protein
MNFIEVLQSVLVSSFGVRKAMICNLQADRLLGVACKRITLIKNKISVFRIPSKKYF